MFCMKRWKWVIFAVVPIAVLAVFLRKPIRNLYVDLTFPLTEHTETEQRVHDYAKANGVRYSAYPASLIALLERNPETESFVLNYPFRESWDGDMSGFSRDTVPLMLQWDPRWGYEKYGSESVVGFTVIDSLDELTAKKIANAKVIDGLIGTKEWGGCNQCYLLKNGKIGVIGHQSYDDNGISVYMNTAFVFNPENFEVSDFKIIGTRSCYPDGPAKKPNLVDCAFTSGIVMRADGKADLYSGIGDTEAGRITIDYPFDEILSTVLCTY